MSLYPKASAPAPVRHTDELREPPDEEARDAVKKKDPREVATDLWRRIDLLQAENAALRLEVQRLTEQLEQAWSRVKSAEAARPPSDAEHRLRLILDFIELTVKR